MNEITGYNISRLKSGSRSEYEKVYLDMFGSLYSLGKQYLGEANEAEEIVQDAFLKLWEVREGLSNDSNIRNFLYTLVKNNCLNRIRNKQTAARLLKKYHSIELEYHYEALEKSGDTYFQFKELKDKIDEAIAGLPDNLRIVFEMNRVGEMRYKDIATQLGISEKTVEARMTKALKILREKLRDYLPVICMITNILNY